MKAILMLIILACISCKAKEKIVEVQLPGVPYPLPPGEVPDYPDPAPKEPDFVSFDRQESDQLELLQAIGQNDQLQTRFLTTCEQYNSGNRDISEFTKAIDKGLNSVSTERRIELSKAAGSTGCSRSFDMRDIGMTSAKWSLVVNRLHELFGNTFESFTTRGILLKQLTQTVQPSIPAHIFLFIALNQPVYAELLELPLTLLELEIQLGVELQDSFDNEDSDTFLFGITQSPISLTKPRLGLRTESDDGFFYNTFDIVVGNAGKAESNVFENPFPVQARSERTLQHDGSESIFSLPNGLNGYFLSDGQGGRQDEAPLDLVINPEAASLDPTINYLSCHDCHASGLIEVEDEIAAKVQNDPSFGIADRQKVEFWHGRLAGFAAEMNRDNELFRESLASVNIGGNERDHINSYTNTLRQEANLEQVAALMSQKPEDFARSLRATVTSLQQIGQLLNGDSVTLEQLKATLPLYVVEANRFRNNFGE